MTFDQFFQSIQSNGQEVPEGFALVPLPIFLMLANQNLAASGSHGQPAGPHGSWNSSLYERAMACSAN